MAPVGATAEASQRKIKASERGDMIGDKGRGELTSGVEAQKVCVAKREEAVETAQAR